jgi:hypothetical protein
MKAPAIPEFRQIRFRKIRFCRSHRAHSNDHHNERGVTMALVALSMMAIIAIAALSVDVVTLLLAREEAQRAADAGALAAARFISFSGLTSDPNNGGDGLLWVCVCGQNPPSGCGTINGQPLPASLATTAAWAAAGQSTISGVGGNAPLTTFSVNVNYLEVANGATLSSQDCTTFFQPNSPYSSFAVNPMVTVQVTRTGLPTFFSRIWGNTGNTASASATAEVFNPSYSASVGTSGAITPVQPRCVKPWFVPNQDPLNAGKGDTCTGGGCSAFVSTTGANPGQILNPGISTDVGGTTGVVGERFTLFPDCREGFGSCQLHQEGAPPPEANFPQGKYGNIPAIPNLAYVPGQVTGTPVAVPSGAVGDTYQEAIGGCDQTTVYQCGVQTANYVDLGVNPAQTQGSGYTTTGVMALIHQTSDTGGQTSTGQDYFNPYGTRTSDAPQILAGSSNPTGISGLITASNSIVSLPIYDSANPNVINNNGSTTPVTVVGFLQVFINGVDQYGDVDVSVMNVAGCGNGSGGTTLNQAVTGSSPVPVRLITPPPS